MSTYRDAHHEAAHAVVAVRLGLPLDYTSVERRDIGGPDGLPSSIPAHEVAGPSFGFTTLVEGTAQSWVDALPSAHAREHLEKFGAQAAAGIVAEIDEETGQLDQRYCRDDMYSIVGIAAALGIGRSSEDKAVRKWMSERVSQAAAVLLSDDAVGWERVAYALHKRKRLTADDVRAELVELAGGVGGLRAGHGWTRIGHKPPESIRNAPNVSKVGKLRNPRHT